ncbi:hypothetical protein QZH41_000039 [Actinostola sp. cb2023]|nr:hypothetical protein QZH41_000039 [Actinostola sp. cb2023]
MWYRFRVKAMFYRVMDDQEFKDKLIGASGFALPCPSEPKKRKLTSLQNVRSTADNEDEDEKDEKCIVSRSVRKPIDFTRCFICRNKTYKKVKELINVSTFEACESVNKAAENKEDDDMLHVLRSINNDLIAAEAKYHKNCFALYVSKKALKSQTASTEQSESRYEAAFQEIRDVIRPGLDQGRAYSMASLLEIYRKILQKEGINPASYTKQRLKVKLQKHFGESIVFHQQSDRSKPEFIYSSKITTQYILNSWLNLSQQLQKKEEDEEDCKANEIFRVARQIKGEFKKCKSINTKPVDVMTKAIVSIQTKEISVLMWQMRDMS